MLVTPLYGALLGILFLALSVRTIRARRHARVAVGDGAVAPLTRAIRAHGNFAEYVPLALLLLFFLEAGGAGKGWIHGLGVLLVAGRLVHAYGISQPREDFRFRVAGMSMTFTVLGLAAVGLLVLPLLS